MARPKGFEPLTPRFVVWCSIQLSYGRHADAPSRKPHGRRRLIKIVLGALASLFRHLRKAVVDRLSPITAPPARASRSGMAMRKQAPAASASSGRSCRHAGGRARPTIVEPEARTARPARALEGEKRSAARRSGMPGPLSVTQMVTVLPLAPCRDRDARRPVACAGLAQSLHGVAHEVDEHARELIRIRIDLRSGGDLRSEARSRRSGARSVRSASSVDERRKRDQRGARGRRSAARP